MSARTPPSSPAASGASSKWCAGAELGASSDPRRELLLTLLQAALASVDGRRCVREVLVGEGAGTAVAAPGPVWLAAVGKAAPAMALGAHEALGARIAQSLIITREGHTPPELLAIPNVEVVTGSHPVPDQRSLAAGARLLEWVEALPIDARPLFLVSGGASSLVEVLKPGTTLVDLERFTERELAAGTAIGELNARRIALSRIKGGRLTARLAGRPARALYVSDVPGDDPGVIGSGILGRASEGEDRIERTIVASVERAVAGAAAAAQARGFTVHAPARRFDGDALRLAARFAHELRLSQSQVCVWGGESTVQLPANPGQGGRNQHLALAAAKLIAGQADLLLLAAGTDGTDGVTDDAGALIDAESCGRIALDGLDVDECLAHADSGRALAASGDLLHLGPTGTNVGDLVIGLKIAPQAPGGAPARHGGPRARML
jgi:hydroxypyruvate reductase